MICPFCGSDRIEPYENRYHCLDCDWLFDEEECQRQELRHQISPLLDGTSEEEPLEIFFNLPSAEAEAQGLSSLEIPAINKIFELEGDGTMWYQLYRDEVPDKWHDLDELEIGDLKALLQYLLKEI